MLFWNIIFDDIPDVFQTPFQGKDLLFFIHIIIKMHH